MAGGRGGGEFMSHEEFSEGSWEISPSFPAPGLTAASSLVVFTIFSFFFRKAELVFFIFHRKGQKKVKSKVYLHLLSSPRCRSDHFPFV